MAISRDSSKSESITVRIPKELIEKARSIVGGGNTKAVLAGLRLLCGEPSPIPDAVPNTVIQEITERLTALEGEINSLKKGLPRSELSGSLNDREYDRGTLSALGIGALRKLYRSIPRKQRSIDANYVTKAQAIEAILEYQNKKAEDEKPIGQ